MGGSIPEDDSDDAPIERAARYWKRAAEMYSRACEAESDETKKLYMHLAMSWASLANELERVPPKVIHHGYGSWARH
jgi:hypothetical protein